MESDGANKTKKLVYIALLVVVVAIGLAVFFAAIPGVEKVYTTKDEFEEQKLKHELVRKDAANAKSYADLLVNIKNNQDLLENALIKEGAEVEFIKKIENIANDVGNEVEIEHKEIEVKRVRTPTSADQSAEEIARQKKEAERAKNKIGLLVTVKGNYRNFLEFLYKLENMPNVFEIESVVVGKGRSMGSLVLGEDKAPEYTEGSILISFNPVNQ